MFDVLLEVFTSKLWVTTNFIENIETFMFIAILFNTVKKVFKKNLGDFFWTCTDDKPLIKIMAKWNKRHFRLDGFIVIKQFINGDNGNKTGCDFLIKCKWGGDILQEIRKNRRLEKRFNWLCWSWVMVCKIGDWNVKYLSGLVFFCGKRAQVFFKFLNVVLFNIFRLIERLFKVFILI